VSVIEAIEMAQDITGKKIKISYTDQNRLGDHMWYISDLTKLKTHYPGWRLQYNNVRLIAEEIYNHKNNLFA
jgi:CDP-paratose 2-epimerase